MNYKQNIFNTIKMLYLAIILVEAATLKMIVAPESIHEYLHINILHGVYIEHLIASIIILSLGALIFLRKA